MRSIVTVFTNEISNVDINVRTILKTSSLPDTNDGSRYSTEQISQFKLKSQDTTGEEEDLHTSVREGSDAYSLTLGITIIVRNVSSENVTAAILAMTAAASSQTLWR